MRRRRRRDIVIGHGPHYTLPIEVLSGEADFLWTRQLFLPHRHGGKKKKKKKEKKHGDWVGMLVRVTAGRQGLDGATIQFVRHNDRNEDRSVRGRKRGGGACRYRERQHAIRHPAHARWRSGSRRAEALDRRYPSGLILASRMIFPHFGMSASIRAANSSGVTETGSKPIVSIFCFTSGSATIRAISR